MFKQSSLVSRIAMMGVMMDDGKLNQTDEDFRQLAALNLYQVHANLTVMSELKRQQANQIYMAIVSAIIAACAVIASEQLSSFAIDALLALMILLNFAWAMTIQYHRRLSTSKFAMLLKLEKELPFQPFADEWKVFKDPKTRPHAIELTKIERMVPIALSCVAIAILLLRHLVDLGGS